MITGALIIGVGQILIGVTTTGIMVVSTAHGDIIAGIGAGAVLVGTTGVGTIGVGTTGVGTMVLAGITAGDGTTGVGMVIMEIIFTTDTVVGITHTGIMPITIVEEGITTEMAFLPIPCEDVPI